MECTGFEQAAAHLPPYRDRLLALPDSIRADTSDIHLSAGQPVALWGRQGVRFLKEDGGTARGPGPGLAVVTPGCLRELFLHICGHSVFSHEEEIRQGYVQAGTCRVGLCGTAVLEKGRVKGMRDITGLVLRIPRVFPGCADRLFLSGVDFARGLLIAGEPGSGKTTLLRDLAQALSAGRFGPSRRVAVLDSRGEIAGGFDLGPCADILRNYPKAQALDMALRTLSPELILCDELAPEDLGAVRRTLYAGVGLIATVHAGREELYRRPLCRKLLETGAFGTVAALYGRSAPSRICHMETPGGRAGRESWAG